MTLSLWLTPEARSDPLDARAWYDAQRPGWGEVLVQSVEACLARIRRTPHAFVTVYGEVRCARLRRFPHGVFYWSEEDRIVVFAIWHSRRDPRGWQRRL